MNSAVLTITLLLYLLAAGLLIKRLASGIEARGSTKAAALASGLIATILHAVTVYHGVVTAEGLNFSFFLALSFTSWVVATLILLSALRQPIENLGIMVFPFAALSLLLQNLQESQGTLISSPTPGLDAHILISVIAYSLLTLAALQAILLAVQNQQLRNRHPGGFIRALPPLETMECLLFRLIGIGFLLLSVSLLSAIPYSQNIIEQHLLHKTVLSVAAWIVFATLLWGRWRFGWRGRTAIRWTLGGFAVLMLSYFGSKLVLELILGS
ncbi:MAG: cytochrome c biogenesis protein CcsA [Gammaproteobacteria bacterium]|nr:cytochrome c biogenesis protein CcsA [Gammaproteobacteria bacterium]